MSITARHLANLAPSSRYSTRRWRSPSSPSVIDLAGAERQRLGALVDLDAGQRARLLDHLDQRRAVLGLLADGLVVEDDAGNVFRHRLGRAEQHLAVVAAAVLGAFRADRVEALLDRAGRFVGGENAAAGRDHGLGDLVEFSEVHRNLHPSCLELVRFCRLLTPLAAAMAKRACSRSLHLAKSRPPAASCPPSIRETRRRPWKHR